MEQLTLCIVYDAEARNALGSQQDFDLVMNWDDPHTEVLVQDERVRASILNIYTSARHRRMPMGYSLIEIEEPLDSVLEQLKRVFNPLIVHDLRLGPRSTP